MQPIYSSVLDKTVKSVKVLVAQSCLTLCESMDWSPPGSSVHGILLARILEWVAIPFSRGSSGPGDRTQFSSNASRFVTVRTNREARLTDKYKKKVGRKDAYKHYFLLCNFIYGVAESQCIIYNWMYHLPSKISKHLWWAGIVLPTHLVK